MEKNIIEQSVLKTISEAIGTSVNRGNSYKYLGLDNDAQKRELVKNLNRKFDLNLTLTEIDFFSSIGKLVDYVTPRIKSSVYTESTSTSNGHLEAKTQVKGQSLTMDELNKEDNSAMISKKYDWAITPDKNKHEYVIGIDFGHGETSAAYCAIGWNASKGQLGAVKDIEFTGNTKVVPSAISITTDGKAYIGDAAFLPEVLAKAQTHVCFKQRPSDIDSVPEQLMMRFMHEVYVAIRERNSALFTDDNHLVYIATPSGWDEDAKELYGTMARKAGLPMGGITSESRAAFIKAQQDPDSGLPQYIDKGAIVFDMGSSTLDFTYLTRDNKNPIDWGDNCGASEIERIIYERKREESDDLKEFETKYPNLVDAILFKAREAKEKIYSHPDEPCNISIDFQNIVEDDEDFEDAKVRFKFYANEPSEERKKKGYVSLNEMLEEKGYISTIRKAMKTFKDEKITGKPIHVAFLTGGASRMDFIKQLVKECWDLSDERIYRDQDPSLTISQGVAVLGRGDIRSGGSQNTKSLLKDITANAGDIFTPFAAALTEKVTDEMQRSVITAFQEFRDSAEDVSLYDLQARIEQWIESDTNSIDDWATECYQQTFEEKTADIRQKLDAIVAEFSNSGVQMGSAGNLALSLPNLDFRELSGQIAEIGTAFSAEAGSITGAVTGIAIGGAIGYGLGMLLGGPLTWLLAGGYFLKKIFWDEEETEEQKKQKALSKDLDASARLQVYNAFFDETEGKWNEVAESIANTVKDAIYGNQSLKKKINEQSRKIIMDYAQECINQTRLMVE